MPSQNKLLQKCNTRLGRALLASIALHVFVLSLPQLESHRHAPALALPLVVHLHPMEAVPRPLSVVTPKIPSQPRRKASQQTTPEMPQLVATTPDTASVQVAPEPAAPAPTTQSASVAPEHAQQVTPPEFAAYLRNTKPRYPASARRNGESGTVLLKVLVTREGLAGRVELESSSASNALDQSALETVKHWRFTPAKRGDDPVEIWVRVPIAFRLEEQ